FDVGMQLNFDNKPHGIGRLDARGVLGALTVSDTPRATHVLAAYQHFDYLDNEAYTFGGMSFGASFFSRMAPHHEISATSALEFNAIVLGATKADYFNLSGRGYDYGPGASLKLRVQVRRRDHTMIDLEQLSYYIHSVNGGTDSSRGTLNRVQ